MPEKIYDSLPERFLLIIEDDEIQADEAVETYLPRLVREGRAVVIDNRKSAGTEQKKMG